MFGKKIAAISLSIAAGVVSAQEIHISVPFSPGGLFSTLVPLTAQSLDERGWKTDVKFVGQCGVSKQSYESARRPTLTVWGTAWLDSKDNTCYIEVDTNNLVDIYVQVPYYLCGPKNAPTWQPVAGSTYTVAMTKSVSPKDHEALAKYGKKLNVTFKPVVYANTGAIRTAWEAKEVDLMLSTIGLEQQQTNGSRCLVSNLHESVGEVKSIWSETGVEPGPIWVGFLLLNPGNLSEEQTNSLKNDIREILATNLEIKEFLDNKFLPDYPGTIEEQLNYIVSQNNPKR